MVMVSALPPPPPPPPPKLLDQNTLNSVVKDVVAEQDRSGNINVFGIQEVSQELGVKPWSRPQESD